MLHGGDVYTEGLLKGRELLDYSSNINPLGIPKSLKEHIFEGLEAVTRYPDLQYRETKKYLTAYLKKIYGVTISEEQLLLGNGAAEIIDLSIASLKSILIVAPSFVEYEISAKKWNCELSYSMLTKEGQYEYEDILEKLSKVEGMILGNPNNPNGNVIDKKFFRKILDFAEKEKKIILIDEAFIEFTGNTNFSLIKELESYSCIFLIRALTKFFSLPGIRFGYGITKNEAMIKFIREKQLPWNINCFAEIAVKYVLQDELYRETSLAWIVGERPRFLEKLRGISIFEKVYDTYGNYVLCKLKDMNCTQLYDACMEKEIVLRKADNYCGLNEKYIRLAIKDEEKNERLLKALEEICNKASSKK